MELRLLLLLLVLLGTSVSVPIIQDGNSCSTHCSQDAGKFQYKDRTAYTYKIVGTNSISVKDSVEKRPIQYTMVAEIVVKDKCNMYLKITDVTGSYKGVEKRYPLHDEILLNSLPFAFSDGRIEHMCPDPSEDEIVRNVKRAVLSALQNSMTSLRTDTYVREADFIGICDTKYQVTEYTDNKITIKKIKDINSCTNRTTGTTAIMREFYKSPFSAYQDMPIFAEESYECEQVVEKNIIKAVTCKERSVFRPFNRHGHMATIEGEMTVELVNVRNIQIERFHTSERVSLVNVFQPPKLPETKESDALSFFRELCPKLEGVVHKSIINEFPKLVDILSRMPPHSVDKVYNAVRKGRPCKSPKALDLFLDALPMAATEGPVRLMAKLIDAQSVNFAKANIWLSLLAFSPRPTAEVVNMALPLLQSENAGRQALLGVSSMIYRFCTLTENCEEVPAVKNAIAALHKRLGYKCRVDSREEEDQIIGVLKAFGNLGILGDAINSILECATTSGSASVPIRLAAIEAFRRTKPKDEVKSKLLEMHGNTAEDTEVRIASYLALMRWPSKDTIKKIKEILNKETCKQVGSFTWTHLTNLQETDAPLKRDVKNLVKNSILKQKFATDWWRYSGNREWAAFNEYLNAGAELENNLIYTTDSHIPKSSSLNLGVDIFNRHINLLEVGGRVEGFDHILESIFGPYGSISSPLKELFTFIKKSRTSDEENRVRTRQEEPEFKSKLDLFDERVNAITRNDPQGSTYIKIFGNELAWFRVRNPEQISSYFNFDFGNIMKQLSQNQKVDIARNFMFLDMKFIIPSVTGRAYNLLLNGGANVGMKAEGKFDVQNLFNSPRQCDIEGRLQPSATLELVTDINILSGPRPGVKLVNTLYTSFDVDGKLEIKDDRLAVARLNLPSDKVEIFSFKSDMYEVDNINKDHPAKTSGIHNFNHCTRSFTRPLGVEFCSKFDLHRPAITSERPYLPITGPVDIEFSIKKTDLPEKGFEFIFELPDKTNSVEKTYRISFDTPESRVPRKHAVQLKISNELRRKEVKFNVQCMTKTVEASALYTELDNSYQGTAELRVDGTRRYSVNAKLDVVDRGSNSEELRPLLELKCHDRDPFVFGGSIVTTTEGDKNQYAVDLKTNKPSNKPVQVVGAVRYQGKPTDIVWQLQTDLKVTLPFVEFHIDATRGSQGKTFISDTNIEYQRPGFSRHSIKMNSKLQNLSTPHLAKVTTISELQMSEYPEYNWQLSWDLQQKPGEHLENDITIKYGEDLQSEERTFRLLQVSKLRGKYLMNKQASSENKLVIKALAFNIDYAINLNTEWDFTEAHKFQMMAGVKYSSEKSVSVEVSYRHSSKKPVNLMLDAKIQYPGREIAYRDLLEELSPNEYKGTSYIQWNKGQHMTIKYAYKRKSDDRKYHHEVEATIDHPHMKDPIEHKTQLLIKDDTIDYRSFTQIEGHPRLFANLQVSQSTLQEISFRFFTIGAKILHQESSPGKWTFDFMTNDQLKGKTYHYNGMAIYSTEGELPNVQFQMNLDTESDPNNKIEMHSVVKALPYRDGKYRVETKLTLPAYDMDIQLENEGTGDWTGPHNVKMVMHDEFDHEPLHLSGQYKIVDRQLTSMIQLQRDKDRLQVDVTGRFILQQNKLEVGGKASLSSTRRKLDGKDITYNLVADFSPRSRSFVSDLRAQVSPGKLYTSKLDYSRYFGETAGNIRARALFTSPHPQWKSEQASLSTEYNAHSLNFNVDVSPSSGKKMEVSTSLEVTGYSAGIRQYLRTPFNPLRSAKAEAKYDFRPGKKLAQASFEVNRKKKFDVNGTLDFESMTSFNGLAAFSTAVTPTVKAHAHAIKDGRNTQFEAGLQKDDTTVLLGKADVTDKGRGFTSRMTLDAGSSRVLEIDVDNTVVSFTERKYKIEMRGPFTPFAVDTKFSRNGDELRTTTNLCFQNAVECSSAEGIYKTEPSGYPGIHRELQLNVKPEGRTELPLKFVFAYGEGTFKNKLLLGTSYGYELSADKATPSRQTLLLRTIMPSREMDAKGTFNVVAGGHFVANLEVRSDVKNYPNRKLTFSVENKLDQSYDDIYEARSTFSIEHPVFKKPVTLYVITKKDDRETSTKLLAVKAELDYSSMADDKLSAEIDVRRKSPRETETNYNVTYSLHLYRADRELDTTIKFNDGSKVTPTEELFSSSVEWEWKDRYGEVKSGLSAIDVDLKKDVFNHWYRSPLCFTDMYGKVTKNEDGNFEAIIESNVDGVHSKTILKAVEEDENNAHFEMEVYTPPETLSKKYEMRGSLLGRPLLVLTAHSYDTGEKITDLALTLSEWKKQKYDLHIHWNPSFASLLVMHVMQIPTQLEEFNLGEAGQEIEDKYFLVDSSFRQSVVEPWQEYSSSEAAKFRADLRKDVTVILDNLYGLMSKIKEALPSAETIQQTVYRTTKDLHTLLFDLFYYLESMTPDSVKTFISEMKQELHDAIKKNCPDTSYCYRIHEAYHESDWDRVRVELRSLLMALPELIITAVQDARTAAGEKLEEVTTDIKTRIVQLPDYMEERLQTVLDAEEVKELREAICAMYEWIADKAGEYNYKLTRKAEEVWREILKNDDIKVVVDFVTSVWKEMKVEFEEHRPNIWDRLKTLMTSTEESETPSPIELLSVEPEQGDLRAVIRMKKARVSSWDDILSLFVDIDDEDDEEDEEEENKDDKDDTVFYSSTKNNLLQIRRLADSWMRPPEHAMLVGGQHFVTFDRKFYDFAGDCTYLLARDFVDKNFTVILKYKHSEDETQPISKSIIVVISDHTIEINPSSMTVLLDDQIVDLPIIDNSFTVSREGHHIVLDDEHGVTVKCHLKYDVCSTIVSGWYYGKTAGLFGTFDYEPNNDMRRPRGQIAGTTSNFARSWELSRGCRSKNTAKEVSLSSSDELYLKCKKYFDDTGSSLSSCFNTVPVDEYFKMCQRHIATQFGKTNSDQAVCDVAAAYAVDCSQNYVDLGLPSICLRCKSLNADETIEYGDEKTYKSRIPRSTDIVFVVEERKCNQPIIKDIDSIARLVDRELTTSGYTNNRYGVVGFGGKTTPHHVHTARGDVFFEVPDVILATERMAFQNGRNGAVDTFDALHFAADYPFRPGVAKAVVLLTCSACKEDHMSITYPVAQQMLLERGIILHVLNDRGIEIKGSATKGKGIVAVDADTVYRDKDVTQKSLEGEPDLRSQVAVPKDVCITLAQEVSGSFFTTSGLTEGQYTDSKNWKSLFARRVAKTAEPPSCQKCECISSSDNVPQTLCRPCNTPRPKVPISLYTSEDPEYF